jgi:hypothetical protein
MEASALPLDGDENENNSDITASVRGLHGWMDGWVGGCERDYLVMRCSINITERGYACTLDRTEHGGRVERW